MSAVVETKLFRSNRRLATGAARGVSRVPGLMQPDRPAEPGA